jgi:hypothetical protein
VYSPRVARVLLLERHTDEREWFVEALKRARHVVFAPTETRATPAELGMVDVVVADLEIAIANGWVREGGGAGMGRPLVVTSGVTSFLAKVAPQVAATLAKPADAKAVAMAVRRALGEERRSVHPSGAHSHTGALPLDALDDPGRDAEIARRGWAEGSTDAELFAVADLVARGTNAPMALVTIVGSLEQTFVGHVGIPIDFAIAGGSPRSWSFCQHAVRSREPLVVDDARNHPSLAHSPLVELDMVRAYAGVPVEVPGFGAVGTVCVLSKEPREFSSKDLAILDLGAKLVGARLASRKPPEPSTVSPAHPATPRDGDGAMAVGDLVDDKYWVTARLGKGGQSDVFLARDRRTSQLVALKVLRSADAGDAWLDEAATLARVRHPSIVQLYGWGRCGRGANGSNGKHGRAYLVLEHIDGDTLREVIFESRATGVLLATTRVAAIVRDLAGALETLHAEQLVHGDVKPSNVILEPKLDRAVLLDFGLGLGPRGGATSVRGGTPGYSAPEQFAADAPMHVGPRLDVYALGALTYAMLTGEAPFAHVRGLSRASAQLRGDVQRPSSLRPGLAVTVDDLLLAALSPDPEKRPATVVAFADDLEGALAASRASATRAKVAGIDAVAQSRGVAFVSYRAHVRRLLGEPAEEALVASLDEEHRAVLAAAVDADEYYPADTLVAYLRAYAGGDLARVEALGEQVAQESLPAVVRAMKIARTPAALIHIAPPLMHRFHDWGRLEISLSDATHATSKLIMPSELAPEMCRYFGGVLKALLALGGKSAEVKHSACVANGAPMCQADVSW